MKANKWCLLLLHAFFINHTDVCGAAELMLCLESAHLGITRSEDSAYLKNYSSAYHADSCRKYKSYSIKFKFSPRIHELDTFAKCKCVITTVT